MCGLYGYITNTEKELTDSEVVQRTNIVKALGLAMQERGTHSTGIAYEKNGTYKIEKQAIDADTFFKRKVSLTDKLNNSRLCLGHTRYATTGAIADRNAHPFRKGTIIGTHNGLVYNHSEIDTMLNMRQEVDSEAIFSLLNEYENDPTSLELLEGVFAITWLDTTTNNLHIVRDGNPFSYAYVDALKTLVWCSEPLPLQCILQATGYQSDILELKENIMLTVTPTLDISITDKVYFKEPAYKSYAGGYYAKDIAKHTTYESEALQKSDKKVSYGSDPMKYLSDGDLREVYEQVVDDGCSYCESEILIEKGFYYDDMTCGVICDNCIDESLAYNSFYFSEGDFIRIAEKMGGIETDCDISEVQEV